MSRVDQDGVEHTGALGYPNTRVALLRGLLVVSAACTALTLAMGPWDLGIRKSLETGQDTMPWVVLHWEPIVNFCFWNLLAFVASQGLPYPSHLHPSMETREG